MTTRYLYHVGLAIVGHKATFQHRRSVDYLSCEIYKYYGQREGTKASAKAKLRETRVAVLAQLNAEHPGRDITSVEVD